ncbi:MAG: DUF433 domain-containing protein [Anaerolineales bacterium]|nr:DUF433 domain-containing protein [Anaerolineales bacterium]
MARYPLNLPAQLKQDAEAWASKQGVSLNQFVLWAVSEKVGSLSQQLDDPNFPGITYRRGASGGVTAVLRGTAIRVQTLAVAANQWQLPLAEIAEQYDLKLSQVEEALAFYQAHQQEIDLAIAAEAEIEAADG